MALGRGAVVPGLGMHAARRDAQRRARRLQGAEARHQRALRNDPSRGESCGARRPQDRPGVHRAAGQHAQSQAGPAVHASRRPRPVGGGAGAAGGGARRRAAHTRHRAHRSARWRQVVAAQVRRLRAARSSRGIRRRRSRARRAGVPARDRRRQRRRHLAVHDFDAGRRHRCDTAGAGLRPGQPLGRILRHARCAGIRPPLPAARARGRARRSRSSVHAHQRRHLAGARGRAGGRVRRVRRRRDLQARVSGPQRDARHRQARARRGTTCPHRRSANRRDATGDAHFRHGGRRAAGADVCPGIRQPRADAAGAGASRETLRRSRLRR